jgi:hypothetical protein
LCGTKDYALTSHNWQLLIWPLKQFASHLRLSLQQPETVQQICHKRVEYETSNMHQNNGLKENSRYK